MNVKAEDLADGRWPEILSAAGIESSHFGKRHGPCPLCGGTDRYRWSEKYGGVWVCSNCTENKWASPFRLLMEHMGYHEFRAAADHVREYFHGVGQSAAPRRHTQDTRSDEQKYQQNLQKMQRLWSEALELIPGDPVTQYLDHRVPGVRIDTKNLRYHPALPYWTPPDEDGVRPICLGHIPAMLARAQDSYGNLVQLHKTYITLNGQKADVPTVKKMESGIGANAFTVRIMDVLGDTLGVSEGLESAYASSMMRNIPVWPCLNGPSMERFELPQELVGQVKRLVIFADNDPPKLRKQTDHGVVMRKPGTLYAEALAKRARAMGLRPMVIMSPFVGEDMANVWEKTV